MNRRVIGFCGGIASGKSARVSHLASRWTQLSAGATALQNHLFLNTAFAQIDADKVGHACYEPGTDCYNKVVAKFGEEILAAPAAAAEPKADSPASKAVESASASSAASSLRPIDRRKLGALVFGTGRMPELEQIVWPAIAAAVQRDIQQQETRARAEAKQALVYVVEAAILPHMTHMLQLCDEVWLFHVSEECAVRRVMKRNGFPADEALKRVRSQSTAEEKAALVRKTGEERQAKGGSGIELRMFDTTAIVTDEEFQGNLAYVASEFEKTVARLISTGPGSKGNNKQ